MVYDSFDCIERSVVFCLLFLDFFFLFVSLAHKVHTSSTHTQTHTHRARTLHTSPIAGQRRKCMIDDWLFSEFLTRAKQKVFTWFPVCCCCFCCHHHWCSSAFSIWFQCIHTFYITWNNALKENQKKRRRERESKREQNTSSALYFYLELFVGQYNNWRAKMNYYCRKKTQEALKEMHVNALSYLFTPTTSFWNAPEKCQRSKENWRLLRERVQSERVKESNQLYLKII